MASRSSRTAWTLGMACLLLAGAPCAVPAVGDGAPGEAPPAFLNGREFPEREPAREACFTVASSRKGPDD